MRIKDFDKVYVIHLAERQDRLKVFLPEFDKVGLRDKLEIRWTSRMNVFKRIAPAIPELNIGIYKGNINRQAGVFGCTFNHYDLIKTSYERGFEHIMVFENDVKFNCEKDIFDLVISKIPDDYKICMLAWNGCNDSDKIQTYLTDDTIYFVNIPGPTWWAHGAYAYCLSREGMKEVIRIFEEDNYFTCFDCCFDHWPVKETTNNNGEKITIMDGFYVINHIPLINAQWSPSSVLMQDEYSKKNIGDQ